MAALLVGMAVAAVLMTAVLPTWRQMIRRDKETELIFRGEQYVRAIALFQKRSGPGVLPPDLDTLVNGRFLRKKFKDPITGQDFDVLSPAQQGGTSGTPAPGQAAPTSAPAQQGRGAQPTTSGAVISAQSGGRGATGGIIGVASKSKETSIRLYNGRTKYNEWQFIFVQQQAPGAAAPGGAPGQRGAVPGSRGAPPAPPAPGGFEGVGGRQGPAGRGNAPNRPTGGRGFQPPTSPVQPSGPAPFGTRPPR